MKRRLNALLARHKEVKRQIAAEKRQPSGGWTDNLQQLKRIKLALKDEIHRLRMRTNGMGSRPGSTSTV